MVFIYKKAYTHAGRFHADDVFSAAFLKILNPELKVQRVIDLPEKIDYTDTIVYDIGRGRFDHHQPDSRVRDNGVPFAAFGLLWERFGMMIFNDKKLVRKFDETFIQGLDQNDNTGEYHQLAAIIGNFNPLWNEEMSENEQFNKAVDFAKIILERVFAKKIAVKEGIALIKKEYEKSDGEVIILDKYIPWKNGLLDTDAKFVIFPSNRGGYNSVSVPVSDTDNTPRIKFPEEWAGLEGDELKKVSGMNGLHFCHRGRFMIHSTDFETIKKATYDTLEKFKNK